MVSSAVLQTQLLFFLSQHSNARFDAAPSDIQFTTVDQRPHPESLYPDIIIWHSFTGTVMRPCSDLCHLGHSWSGLKWHGTC